MNKKLKNKKLPQLSAELTSVMFSTMLFALEGKEQIISLVPALLMSPSNEENLKTLEWMLKKNLDQSINVVCLLGLAEKLLKQENSARATVSLIYIGHRIIFNQNNKEPSRKESQQIWTAVWNFCGQIPSVASEIKAKKEINDLHDWKLDVQDFARRRWRTLKDEQMPRVKAEIQEMQKSVFAFLNIKPS